MQSNHNKLWTDCLTVIKDIVPKDAFDTWFLPIVPLSYEEKKITIQVPSQFFYEYLEEKYVNVLKMTIHRVFGDDAVLNYRVMVGKMQGGTVDYPTEKVAPVLSKSGGVDVKRAPMTPFTQVAPQDLDSQLNTRYTFDSYFEGNNNKLARTAGDEISKNPGKTTFNPLFIYGASGVGKTHLCHAIGLRTRALYPEKRVLYVSANLFTLQYSSASLNNNLNDFLNFYQSLDVLILDDIQTLIGKEKTQNVFFQIFNHLHQMGKQLVMTSDKPPVELQKMQERLITRFRWGLTAELGRPDLSLRKKILRSKTEREGVVIPDDVFEFIAEHVTANVRDLEGVLVSLMANSLITEQEVDMALAQRVIAQMVLIEDKQVSIEKIKSTVCGYFHLEEALILTPSRKREIVQARQITMYLAKKYTESSFSYIGKVVGGKDHATVLHACKIVKDQIEINKSFRKAVETIEGTLKN